MGNYDYKKDKATEEETIAKLMQELPTLFDFVLGVKKYEGAFIEGDIILTLKNPFGGELRDLLTEVKEDFGCARTGNIAIEFFSRGKKSGIDATKSTFYLFKAHRGANSYTYALVSVKNLRELCKGKREIPMGDAGSGGKGYLLNFQSFLRNKFVKHVTVTYEQ